MNWLRQMLRLPEHFADNGVIQGSASDSVLVAVLSARERALAGSEVGAWFVY
jgi:glutamate/tyrosine decarboxylase-like PLP-dependent enzyme